ncbi:MAG TPA: STAS domain-containing protein [Streptosporangiaceae bacterium]|nr:STAS domain-containing protein [Streptosporangiaceae bacterium]
MIKYTSSRTLPHTRTGARSTTTVRVPRQGTFAKPESSSLGLGSLGLGPQLRISSVTGIDGSQVVSVAGELDIATAEQAYDYLSDVIDHGKTPVHVNLGELTFCDASGLSVLAKAANRAREAHRALMLTSVRPSLVKIMRITGLDGAFPEVCR